MIRIRRSKLNHIEFKPGGGGRWRPFPRAGSRFGQELIAAVKLDRSDLLDQYKRHAEMFEDGLTRIRRALLGSVPSTVVEGEWNEVTRRWLSAQCQFTALSRDILVHNFKADIARYSLDISLRYP